jgi:PAS domain S-box-containing protein
MPGPPGIDATLLRAVVDTAISGVILIDARGCVLMFNPACEKLFEYTAAEVIGQNVKMLMPGPYREEHDGYIENFRRTGERKIIGIGREVFGQRKDGTTFPMDLSVDEAKQDEKPIFVGIVHDLTERKRTEELLVQAQEIKTVGQLTRGIAHDLNTLLTVIVGNAEFLSECTGGLTATRPRYCQSRRPRRRIDTAARDLWPRVDTLSGQDRLQTIYSVRCINCGAGRRKN